MAAKATAPLFADGEALATQRLRLSLLSPDALEPMSGWLEAALAPDWRLDDLAAAVEAGAAVLIADQGGAAIGGAVALVGCPDEGSAALPFIGIDPARRYRGLGGEAGLALERHLRRRFAVEKVYAPVPDGRGLAVYFWLRLGYRPLTTAEAPGPLVGLSSESRPGIWMVRDAD